MRTYIYISSYHNDGSFALFNLLISPLSSLFSSCIFLFSWWMHAVGSGGDDEEEDGRRIEDDGGAEESVM